MDIDTVIDRSGGVVKMAAELGVSHSTVCDWRRTGFLPGGRAVQISAKLGIPLDSLSHLIRSSGKSQSAEGAAA